MTDTRRVLLIGGHLDGQWADTAPNAITYRVMRPLTGEYWQLDPKAAGAGIPMPEEVNYRIERMPVAIGHARADIWIGILLELRGPERDLVIVRTLFQRDVAALFKEAW